MPFGVFAGCISTSAQKKLYIAEGNHLRCTLLDLYDVGKV